MQAVSTNSDFSDIETSRGNYFATGEWEIETTTLDMIVLASSEYDPVTDTGTQCAGYTTTNPGGAPNSLDPANYDYYSVNLDWKSAVAVDTTGLVPRALGKCCGNSFQHLFPLAPCACHLGHLFSL